MGLWSAIGIFGEQCKRLHNSLSMTQVQMNVKCIYTTQNLFIEPNVTYSIYWELTHQTQNQGFSPSHNYAVR